MPEIAATPRNGLHVISTFSGCGGSCLGFEMAGYEILAASEFVSAARETYELNHPGVPIDPRDIRLVEPSELLSLAGVGIGEVDVLEGSPPCSSFSTAGKGAKHWGKATAYSDTEQRTDDLFFEFARLVEGIQPRVFIAENVSGLVKGDSKGYFKLIFRRLAEVGYRVEARMLDAQWLGVPQRRRRIIFQGIRNDLDRSPAWPKPFPYRYTIAEALGHSGSVLYRGGSQFEMVEERNRPAPTITAEERATENTTIIGDPALADPETGESLRVRRTAPNEFAARVLARDGLQFTIGSRVKHDLSSSWSIGDVTHQPSPTVLAQRPSTFQVEGNGDTVTDPETGERIDLGGTAIGRAYGRLRPGESSDKYFNLVRPKMGEASATVTVAAHMDRTTAGVAHPSSPRKFTLGELRRICGFPDDFILTGSYSQRWERLGRAVPPPMMAAVAQALTPILL